MIFARTFVVMKCEKKQSQLVTQKVRLANMEVAAAMTDAVVDAKDGAG